MMFVHSTPSPVEADFLRVFLESHGIGCRLRNERAARSTAAVFGITLPDVWVEVWITDPARAAEAAALVERWKDGEEDPDPGGAWRCPSCGEAVGATFGACWKCGSPRPSR